MNITMVTFTGTSLRTLDDASLLQLLLREDLPRYLMNAYNSEADKRMQSLPTTALYTEEVPG